MITTHLSPLMPAPVDLLEKNHQILYLGLTPSFQVKHRFRVANENFRATIRVVPLRRAAQLVNQKTITTTQQQHYNTHN